jgi:hypothetical protein
MSSWTAAAIVLAADTLASGAGGASTGAAGLFRELAAPSSVWQAADPAACGCPEGSPAEK